VVVIRSMYQESHYSSTGTLNQVTTT